MREHGHMNLGLSLGFDSHRGVLVIAKHFSLTVVLR
jgi:hypothetical protein